MQRSPDPVQGSGVLDVVVRHWMRAHDLHYEQHHDAGEGQLDQPDGCRGRAERPNSGQVPTTLASAASSMASMYGSGFLRTGAVFGRQVDVCLPRRPRRRPAAQWLTDNSLVDGGGASSFLTSHPDPDLA